MLPLDFQKQHLLGYFEHIMKPLASLKRNISRLFFVEYSYEEIDSTLIYKIAREMKGAAGQTDFNADGWLRIIIFSSLGSTDKISVTH